MLAAGMVMVWLKISGSPRVSHDLARIDKVGKRIFSAGIPDQVGPWLGPGVVASLQAVPAIMVELEEVVVTAQKREQSLRDVG